MEEYEKNVTYDVESLFTTIPVRLTLDCIIDQIYMKKKVTPVCTKSVFTRLHINLATECKFTFSKSFHQQIDGFAIGNPLSVTLHLYGKIRKLSCRTT